LLGTIRKRDVPFRGPNAIELYQFRGSPPRTDIRRNYPMGNKWRTLQGIQVTESENHSGWDYGGYWENQTVYRITPDVGGDFTTQKKSVQSPVFPEAVSVSSGWFLAYPGMEEKDTLVGALLPLPPEQMPFPPSGRSSEDDLKEFGTTAIARCAPTNSVADLSTALIELKREGIPKLLGSLFWKSRSGRLRDVAKQSGNEYLNVEFGWKPLLADITDLAKGVLHLDKLISQYVRDAGKVVRRRYEFPPIISNDTVVVKSNVSPYLVHGVDIISVYDMPSINKGTVYRHRETTIRRWFSGAFTYHLPSDLGSWMGSDVVLARKLLGGNITPEVIWNLAPWSWAADWFGNFGDMLHVTSSLADDGLVMKYGYIMEHSIVRDTYTFVGPTGFKTQFVHPTPVILVSETKIRRRATPYGFGLNWSGFTNHQKSILAALGLSRIR